jgi:hypothetical protein
MGARQKCPRRRRDFRARLNEKFDHKGRRLQAIKILEPLDKYPDHPGIAHYLIHSRLRRSRKGHPAANKYADRAVRRTQHMPSHISMVGM